MNHLSKTTSTYIETLGCAKNRVDSEIMLSCLLQHHFQYCEFPEKADVIIVNTCGFLTSAVTESIERILELAQNKTTGKCKKLVVAGCMSERYQDSLLEELPEVDAIIGTSDYTQIVSCINQALVEEERKSYFQKRPLYSSNNLNIQRVLSTKKHYSFLKISEGCSNMCSFCNIPALRGRFSSRLMPHIKAEFEQMLAWGIREINLISQDSSSYGIDLPKQHSLLNLVDLLLNNSNDVFWLRIFYSYPNRYPIELFDRMNQDKRLVPYVDMPFQHISDTVLKDMNRRITKKEIYHILKIAHQKVPDLSFRTTFIVGFPTETEACFQELLEFVQEGWFTHIGVFMYSHEDNIVSKKFGDLVPLKVKEERRKILMEAQKQVLQKKNQSLIGTKQQILVEGVSDEHELLLQGRTKYQGVDVDGIVFINEGKATAGEFTQVHITEAHPYDLVGKIYSPYYS